MSEEPKTAAPNAKGATSGASAADAAAKAQVRIDTSHLKSSYCNVSNVTSTREEVVINFGINQNWDLAQKELTVELHHRVILSPLGAKRLHTTLGKLLQEFESRYGPLN